MGTVALFLHTMAHCSAEFSSMSQIRGGHLKMQSPKNKKIDFLFSPDAPTLDVSSSICFKSFVVGDIRWDYIHTLHKMGSSLALRRLIQFIIIQKAMIGLSFDLSDLCAVKHTFFFLFSMIFLIHIYRGLNIITP